VAEEVEESSTLVEHREPQVALEHDSFETPRLACTRRELEGQWELQEHLAVVVQFLMVLEPLRRQLAVDHLFGWALLLPATPPQLTFCCFLGAVVCGQIRFQNTYGCWSFENHLQGACSNAFLFFCLVEVGVTRFLILLLLRWRVSRVLTL
jgi:hypothetical protein